ncbi:uncharacterized protein LOC127850309 [Dreissena polymorpha]|uniref:Uncharacterized protein n=1 Tax=Dreissena polymorpha TaxID=45954 RepID=A0A9D4HWH5_DREPO|nr:uncharacterized protein LOC127850309 [Dreissena polymorpha]XP_052239211.1 uncharacterized protein LOC127850309 [Dreissena polymorpha]XP_052239212.1 uncharacterized protein LOC127850309 [Dreissena polymorpha]XP_052239213.1 uncharacterized protein LOC127850309 [Dreissena polymorpha]KAH3737860.1 hypothetical protein DPMN_044458 [Dreissena polymorpha]
MAVRKGLQKLVLLLAVWVAFIKQGNAENMNGRYLVASGSNQGVPFNDDYASKGHEYFDVWSPELATHYGEVFWTDQGNNPIPKEIIDRFKGKVMAITGYEQDQVMVTPTGKPGLNPDLDVSVPINWAYNHHYMAWMTGDHSEMVRISNPDPKDVSDHGSPMRWMAVNKPTSKRLDPKIPTSQMFSEGNGGESRKSFHGYPDGYAQLIDSPNMWHITPMQIDTRNRDCGVTPKDVNNCTNHVNPGPEPRQARYGLGIPKEGSPYSGILECPCNGRYGGDPSIYGEGTLTKKINHHYTCISQPSCGNAVIGNAPECFDAVYQLGLLVSKNITLTPGTTGVPVGCTVQSLSDGTLSATYNPTASTTQCSTSVQRYGTTAFEVGTKIGITLNSTMALITISGPDDVWFGVGFNATHMADSPYTIIINSDGVYERQIGTCGSEAEHCPGDALDTSVTVVSTTVQDGKRTVVLSRPLKGKTSKHYTFDITNEAQIPFISAIGYSQKFDYHKAHSSGLVVLLAHGEQNCICDIGKSGYMCDNNGTNCDTFVKNCVPAPDGDLLSQQNPTCNSIQYAGGLQCCKHGRIMLDADQEIRPELLRYHMKFRFWFQEYKVDGEQVSHYDLPRIYYQTEAWAGEYDIPPAFAAPGKPIPGYPNWPANTPTPGTKCSGDCPNGKDCDCVHTIVFRWTVSNMRLIYAGGHCHAPSCISLNLYRNDTGHEMELLCSQMPVYGSGNVTHNKYDELGYLALPPCLWGNDKGLQPSVFLGPNTPLVSIKHNHNTNMGHYGEMASWQMRGTFF